MAKKKTFLILLIIGSILLCACSGKTPAESGTVENAAELVMSSLKTLDLDTFNSTRTIIYAPTATGLGFRPQRNTGSLMNFCSPPL